MKNTRQNSASIKKKVTNVLVHLFLTILSVIWVFPIFWVVLLSFREQKGQYITSFWPKKFTMANYVKLFTDTALFNFPKWFLNTLFVAICSCILTTFFVLAISYCLSRLRFKIRKPYMNVAMILGMFPGFMSMIAVYYILKGFGLTKGPMIFLALIMVYSGGAGLGFYVSKGFFDTIPKALDEAAIVDGATKWDVFSKIIMPLSKPIIVSTIMTSFMAGFHLRKGNCRCGSEILYGCDRSVHDADQGKYRKLVCLLRSWRSLRFHSDRYSVPEFAEILCRRYVRSS